MTNCNDHQRRAWRKDIKRELKRRGYAVLDPTEDTARKGAFAVTADVDEADVVIANLWKESIGTVLGIVQARRSDTPVILIDQHYIDSPVLEAFVDCVVRSEEKAVNALDELFPKLSHVIHVKKKDGKTTIFDRGKDQQVIEGKKQYRICATVVDSAMLDWWLRGFGKAVNKISKASLQI